MTMPLSASEWLKQQSQTQVGTPILPMTPSTSAGPLSAADWLNLQSARQDSASHPSFLRRIGNFVKSHVSQGPTDQEALAFYQQRTGRPAPSIEAARGLYARTGGPTSIGQILGAASFAVPGLGEAKAVGLAAKVAPKLVENAIGRGAVAGLGGGAAFGALQGAAQVAEGKPAKEAIKTAGEAAATMAALGGINGLVGKFIRNAFRKTATAVASEPPKLLGLPEHASVPDFIAGTKEVQVQKEVPAMVSRDVSKWDQFVARNREYVDQLATLATRAARALTGSEPEARRQAIRFLSRAYPEQPRAQWDTFTTQELKDAVKRLTGGLKTKDALVAPMIAHVAEQEGTSLEALLADIELSPGQRLLDYAKQVRLARAAGVEPPPAPKEFVLGTKTITTTEQQPFVRAVQPEGVAHTISTHRMAVVRAPQTIEQGEALAKKLMSLPTPEIAATTEHLAGAEATRAPSTAGEGLNRLVLTNEAWLRRHGAGVVADLVRESERRAAMRIGEIDRTMLHTVARLTQEERYNLRSVVRGEAKPMNDRVRAVADQVKAYYDERAKRIAQAGLSLVDAQTGEKTTFQGAELHFPRRYDWNKVLDIRRRPKKDVLQSLVDSGQANNTIEAEKLLNTIRNKPHERVGGFQYVVKAKLPEQYELDPLKELQLDVQAAERRIAQAEVLGPNDENIHNTIESLPEDIRTHARKVRDDILGIHVQDQITNALVHFFLNFNTMRLLFSQIANVGQIGNSIMQTSLKDFARGVFSVFKNRQEAIEFAQRAGNLLGPNEIARELAEEGGIGEKFLRATGFLATEQGLRVLTSQMAKGWAEDLFRALQDPASSPFWIRVRGVVGKGEDRIRSIFSKAGVNIDAALQRGSLTDDDLRRVANWVVHQTQFTASALDRPLWAGSPWGRVAFQFKRFSYRQYVFLKKNLYDEIRDYARTGGRKGSLRQLGTFLTVFPSLGWVIGYIRDKLSGKERPQSIANQVLEAYSWAGGVGTISDMFQAIANGSQSFLTWVGGPTVRLVSDVVGALTPLAQAAIQEEQHLTEGAKAPDIAGKATSSAKAALRAIPSVGTSLSQGQVPVLGPLFGVNIPGLRERLNPHDALVDAYVRSKVEGDPTILTEYVRKNKIKPTQVQALNRNPDVQIRIIQEMMKRNPDERDYWQGRLDYWRKKKAK